MAKVPGERWLAKPGKSVDLGKIKPASTAGAPGDEDETNAATETLRVELVELQERLWAENKQALLLVLQAMDAGGKDGTVKKVFSGVNPQGVRVRSFKEPSEEELAHDFLWRVHPHAPVPRRDRDLQSVALRVSSRRARLRARPGEDVAPALRHHPRLRAGPRQCRHPRGQSDAAHL